MRLGNFFDAIGTPDVVPVNPRPIAITLICSNDMLPNGKPNPGGRPIKARGKAALVAMTGPDVIKSLVRARKLLAEIVEPLIDPETKLPPKTTEAEENIAAVYEQLARVVREWEEATHTVGGPLFADASIALGLVSYEEALRVMAEYRKYMADEHPAEVDPSTRNKSQSRGPRVAAGAPR